MMYNLRDIISIRDVSGTGQCTTVSCSLCRCYFLSRCRHSGLFRGFRSDISQLEISTWRWSRSSQPCRQSSVHSPSAVGVTLRWTSWSSPTKHVRPRCTIETATWSRLPRWSSVRIRVSHRRSVTSSAGHVYQQQRLPTVVGSRPRTSRSFAHITTNACFNTARVIFSNNSPRRT